MVENMMFEGIEEYSRQGSDIIVRCLECGKEVRAEFETESGIAYAVWKCCGNQAYQTLGEVLLSKAKMQ